MNKAVVEFLIIFNVVTCEPLPFHSSSDFDPTEMNMGLYILSEDLEKAGLCSIEEVYNAVMQAKPTVTRMPKPFYCGEVIAAGCYDYASASILVGMEENENCLANTAFLHEIVHIILMYLYHTYDSDHLKYKEWWKIADFEAPKKFAELTCNKKE